MAELLRALSNYGRLAGLLGLFAFAVAGVFFLIDPTLEGYIRPLLGIGGALIVLFLLGSLDEIRTLLLGRSARYSTNTTIMILAFLGIVVVLNLLVVRYSQRFDLTQAQSFTLSPQTVRVLEGLKEPIKVIGFFSPDLAAAGAQQQAQDLLTEYSHKSEKVSFEFVDPFRQPALVSKYNIRTDGSIIFECCGRTQTVTRSDEQTFTSAILKITRGAQKKVYFLTGHGERESNDFREAGYGEVSRALQDDNYAVEPLNLVVSQTVPSDAALVIIAQPTKALAEAEKKALNDYLDKNGKALILLGPNRDTGIDEILTRFDIVVSEGAVVDPASSLLGDPLTPVIQRYPFTDITRDLPLSFFPRPQVVTSTVPLGTVITPTGRLEGLVRVEALAQTSDRSWLEKDPNVAQFTPGVDVQGPLPIALLVEPANLPQASLNPDQAKGTRIVVFGNADFASNQLVGQFGNLDFFLNAVNWLAEDEDLISVRPKPPDFRRMFIGPNQSNLIFVTSVVILPLLVLAAGGVVWWRRR